ncbi:uracil-DNA glycosylase family protein [Lacinutrix neustonica]|uniref:Uracil-DNA glycosylase family protein n=1 Tax=Lacinutrix neustonica TaxID=2980107 RepID=A0A9E8MXD1_9FLAO|nr:uracil-DNA glycosylase family protein [Lacinutrix neustonica]WAC03403.1 uracil-DNA glycosylase family protein [Lacinutrix neustonica]
MFKHSHPYPPFIKNSTRKLIVGTLPPPGFTTGDLLEKDVDFCYGSYYNSLWLFIDSIHHLNLRYDNSEEAVSQRKAFLIKQNIGVCDIVESCEREKIEASDLGMKHVELRNIIGYLKEYPAIDTLLFTGGNSKNGPEYFFRKQIRDHGLKLELVSKETPRRHQFVMPVDAGHSPELQRVVKTVSLTSASGAANISIGSNPLYKQLKARHPKFTTFDFRVLQYREFL